jgi:hypothetical protein
MGNIKGQVTVFIVVGVVILFSALVLLFLNNFVFEDGNLNLILSEEMIQKETIKGYIEECITNLAVDGLTRLGYQGGYIDPSQWNYFNDLAFSYEGNAVLFSPNSDLVIPYWHHLRGNDCPNNICSYGLGIPPLRRITGDRFDMSIESQLDYYISDNLDTCLNNFDVFSESGYEINQRSDPVTITSVFPETVNFDVMWPIEVSKPSIELTLNLDEFQIDVPLDLENIYNNAIYIIANQIQRSYFERSVINMITIFSGKDSNKLPPITASGIDPTSTVFWIKNKVEENVEGMLTSYIPAHQYYNSNNYKQRSTGDSFNDYFYNEAVLIPSTDGAEKLDVNFDYLSGFWDLYFDLNCDGQLCRPESVSVFDIVNIGLQKYKFYYDLSFPVLVSLKDKDGLNSGKGYTFQFFVEVNIRDNKPLRGNHTPPLEIQGDDEETASMFCDYDKRNSGLINITVKDVLKNETIPDVHVLYSIADENCIIGKTNKNGVLAEKFPISFGGVITFTKQDYLTKFEVYSTQLNQSDAFEVNITSKLRKNIEIKKKYLKIVPPYTDKKLELDNNELLFSKQEYAYMTLQRVSELNEQSEFAFAHYARNGSDYYDELTDTDFFVDVGVGTYEIEITLMTKKPFKVPEYPECYDTGWFGDKECVTIPEIVVNESIAGKAKFNYTFTVQDLLNTSNITFYVAAPNHHLIPENERKVEIMDYMMLNDSIYMQASPFLMPVFE